jgi:activating signal cointegrator complex subunit 3
MFFDGRIMILVATATLAWGVNLPAHMVIVKGTEFFDGKTNRYVDYPLTDVMQMIGRAYVMASDPVFFLI